MIVRAGDFSNKMVLALLQEHLSGMHASSPPGAVYALEPSRLQSQGVSFYSVWTGEELTAIGALKEIDASTGEVKSMRTANAHLRGGAAAFLLEHLIAEARARGYLRLSLETGSGPAFDPALALYRKFGFEKGEQFGDYETSAFNQFLHLQL